MSEREEAGVGRVMGVDYGRRHVGIALTDPNRVIASPLETLDVSGPEEAIEKIARLSEEHEIVEVVVGLPKSLNGEEGAMSEEVRVWSEKLGEITGLPIHLADERLTSREAEQTAREVGKKSRRIDRGRNKGKIKGKNKGRGERNDHIAASFVLRLFIESNR